MVRKQADRRTAAHRQASNIEIIAGILKRGECGADGATISPAEDSGSVQNREYLDYLLKQGFINTLVLDENRVAYRVTESGFRLLRAIDSLMAMIGTDVEDNIKT